MDSFEKKSARPRGGREFVNVPDPQREEADRRQSLGAVSQQCEARHPEACAKLRLFLDGVDFQNLYGIFYEYFDKSEVPRERLNHKINFFFGEYNNQENVASYVMTANAIIFNIPYFERLFNNEQGPSGAENAYRVFLHALVHEYGHAFSHTEHLHEEGVDHGQPVLYKVTTIGFDRDASMHHLSDADNTIHAGAPARIYELFNEGINELLSQEVVQEYARRNPIDKRLAGVTGPGTVSVGHMAEANISKERRIYSIAERFVVSLTEAIAEKTGVSQKEVWRSILRQYFSGEIEFRDFGPLLDELWDEGFARDLADARDGLDLTNLALRFKEISAKYPEAVEQWLKHLDLSRGAK